MALKPTGKSVRIKARAISQSGVVSAVFSAEYRENERLKGWNGVDLYAAGIFLATTSSVQTYFPTGFGAALGARMGLDSFWIPQQSDVRARAFYLPGVWGEFSYLGFAQGSYSEGALTALVGPEWQLPLAPSRTLMFTFALGAGASQISLTTPAYAASGVTPALAAKSGVEYHWQRYALFAQMRYMYFADQTSPLTGAGFSAGALWKL